MSQYGWICPKCGRCYAPSMLQCFSCAPPVIVGGQVIPDVPGLTITTTNSSAAPGSAEPK